MSWMDKSETKTDGLKERAAAQTAAAEDVELEQALKDFKLSVHAWSDAALSRPWTVAHEVRRWSWRLAAGWALGCVLVAGSVSGGLLERQHQKEQARVADQEREADRQTQLKEQHARAQVSDETLLADVDSDVSRQVPSALEPLAQMMGDDESK